MTIPKSPGDVTDGVNTDSKVAAGRASPARTISQPLSRLIAAPPPRGRCVSRVSEYCSTNRHDEGDLADHNKASAGDVMFLAIDRLPPPSMASYIWS